MIHFLPHCPIYADFAIINHMLNISFIVPAYNEEEILGQCLKSILDEVAQNPQINSEVIVVNNASTDNTKNIAMSFAGVKVVDEPKKGLIFARSAGAKAAVGELLAHIDADGILPTGWLKTVVTEFARNKKLVALSGPHVYYDLSELKKIGVRLFYYLTFLSYLINRFILRIGSMMQGGNFVVRAWAWKQIGETSSNFNFYGEDIELARRLNKVGGVKFTFSLPIYISGRRFANEGFFTVGARYALNYFSVLFLKKPATKNYKDIRPV